MYCERCNIDFPEGLRYCKWCGQTLIERHRNTKELSFCPNCAAAVKPNWAFCKACGVRLAVVAAETPAASCPKCGTAVRPGGLHCVNCGFDLQISLNSIPAGVETPATSIIASCPSCNEHIDPGSVYCKSCGSALYVQPTPVSSAGNSAIVCPQCQGFSPVGSVSCQSCGTSLLVNPQEGGPGDQGETRAISQPESSTLRDLADHLPVRPSNQHPAPPVEGPPPQFRPQPHNDTDERATPLASADSIDANAETLTFDAQRTDFNQSIPPEVQPPAAPAQPKSGGGDTSMLPGVAGSKFEQPQPTVALNMGRNTGPFAGAEEEASEPEASTPREPHPPAPPPPVIETAAPPALQKSPFAAPPERSSAETFTFVTDVEIAPPPPVQEGTIIFGTEPPPPGEANALQSMPFVVQDVPPPGPEFQSSPITPPNAPPVQMTQPPASFPPPPVGHIDRAGAEGATQVVPAAPPRVETDSAAVEEAKRQFAAPGPVSPPRPVPPPSAAPPIGRVPPPWPEPSGTGYQTPPAALPSSPAPHKKSSLGVVLSVIAAVVVIAVLGGVVWWYIAGGRRKPSVKPPVETPVEAPVQPPVTTPAPPPVAALPAGMVAVPAGVYIIGRDHESDLEKPRHTETLPAYFIDRTEVTNDAFKRFVDATGHRPPLNWRGKDYPTGRANYPVTGITWQDAVDFATWAGKRLPTEAEWEAAARGPEGRRYPWGNEWFPGQANIGVPEGEPAKDDEYPPQISEVGGYPQGASPVGALDMIGNVWEYTADEFKLYPGNPETLENVAKQLKFEVKPDVIYRVIRGGAFDGNRDHDASYRGRVNANRAFPKTGFRCVKDAVSH